METISAQTNIVAFLCAQPQFTPNSDRNELFKQFFNEQGAVVLVCKFQGNPLKLKIFNKKEGVDLNKTHRLFENEVIHSEELTSQRQIFAPAEDNKTRMISTKVTMLSDQSTGIGRIIVYKKEKVDMVYEGEIVDGLPNGFGRIMYYCSATQQIPIVPEQVKSLVGNFVKGKPQGKFIKFHLKDEEIAVTITFVLRSMVQIEKQGTIIVPDTKEQKAWNETNFDSLQFNEAEVKTFKEGAEPQQEEEKKQSSTTAPDDKYSITDMLNEKMKNLDLNKENKAKYPQFKAFDEGVNITCIGPDDHEKVIQNENKDVFVVYYNSITPDYAKKTHKETFRQLQVMLNVAKELQNVKNLLFCSFDRGLSCIPNLDKQMVEELEAFTRGEPYYVLFPKYNKKGIRYGFDVDEHFVQKFLEQKGCAIRELKNINRSMEGGKHTGYFTEEREQTTKNFSDVSFWTNESPGKAKTVDELLGELSD